LLNDFFGWDGGQFSLRYVVVLFEWDKTRGVAMKAEVHPAVFDSGDL